LPSQFLKLPREEKAFLIASIQLKAEKEKKEAKKMKKR
jgi:TfoX/Sxy family transcriptional regulator of competence genes